MSEYADRDIIAQGEYYVRHVSAMTGEDLHNKSCIAAELAHRDIEIAKLKEQLAAREAWIKDKINCCCYQINDPDSDYNGCSCEGGCTCHDVLLQGFPILREHEARLLQQVADEFTKPEYKGFGISAAVLELTREAAARRTK